MLGDVKIVVLDSTAVQGVESGVGMPAYFSRYAIDHLLNLDHEIHVTNHLDSGAVASADVVWSEWCNDPARPVAR